MMQLAPTTPSQYITKPGIFGTQTTRFFYKQHFYKQCHAEKGKKPSNAKQHPEAELLLPEKYSHSSSRYHPSIFKRRKITNVSLYMRLYD